MSLGYNIPSHTTFPIRREVAIDGPCRLLPAGPRIEPPLAGLTVKARAGLKGEKLLVIVLDRPPAKLGRAACRIIVPLMLQGGGEKKELLVPLSGVFVK